MCDVIVNIDDEAKVSSPSRYNTGEGVFQDHGVIRLGGQYFAP
jgi:hypothetical protein